MCINAIAKSQIVAKFCKKKKEEAMKKLMTFI
jgi:hypothetical protein